MKLTKRQLKALEKVQAKVKAFNEGRPPLWTAKNLLNKEPNAMTRNRRYDPECYGELPLPKKKRFK